MVTETPTRPGRISPDAVVGQHERRMRHTRHTRQNLLLLVIATLLGLWLGLSAPGVSPVAAPALASAVALVAPAGPAFLSIP